jgi:hypothetical protein
MAEIEHKQGIPNSLEEKILEPITEEELRAKEFITPEDVLRLNKITEGKILYVLSKLYAKNSVTTLYLTSECSNVKQSVVTTHAQAYVYVRHVVVSGKKFKNMSSYVVWRSDG